MELLIYTFARMAESNSDIKTGTEVKASFEVPAIIRISMGVLRSLAPSLGLRYALYLFFKPIKFGIPDREKGLRRSARIHELKLGNKKAKLFEWGKGERKILLMHGWSGRASQFSDLIKALVNKGFHVYSVEAPAHGEDKAKSTHMLEFVEAISVGLKDHGPFSMAIGHSLGGMALFNAQVRRSANFKSIACVGSPANIRWVIADFVEKVNAGERIEQGIVDRMESRFNIQLGDASTDELAKQADIQGLIFHDEDDKDVGMHHAKRLKEYWPKAELISSSGLGHRRILASPHLIDRIIAEADSLT